ncbi:unnamed protein product [Prorocentrum cordatum]|uniref:Uncharacterized protein n=1 Tax=Prorocentrum cordatum TaxID=2364126 RepID=A0ABN9RUH0_9DINO|nr:unnamed protein product [Polarella glacialis]
MQSSPRAACLLLLCCAAQPVASLSAAEAWPWSRRAPKAPPVAAEAPANATEGAPEEAEAGAAAPAANASEGAAEAAPAEAGAAEAAARAAGVQAAGRSPTRPGLFVSLYMRMPSGCPKLAMDTQKWRHDTWAEQKDLDEAACQGRAKLWNGYCASEDAMMAFVPKQ